MSQEKTIRWGILGPGKIAYKFCSDLQQIQGNKITAVASRSMDRAKAFATEYAIPNSYSSYEELSQSTEVDIIYIATPHTYHCENAIMCLRNGNHVLCEKPMAINKKQIDEMITVAVENKCFLMEAIWSAFFPSIRKMNELIADGAIGNIKMIEADFGFMAPVDYSKRLYNADLAGGALLDIGIYPLFLAHLLKGRPKEIKAMTTMTETQVDGSTAISLSWDDGTLASLNTTIFADSPTTAKISGPKGYIVLHRRWHEAREISLYNKGGLVNTWTYKDDCFGYRYEIEEVQQCLIKGKIESSVLTHKFSQSLMSSMDSTREQIGLKYPFE